MLHDSDRAILREQQHDAAPTQAEYLADCARDGRCPQCGGDQSVIVGWNFAQDIPIYATCQECGGLGTWEAARGGTIPCPECDGDGRFPAYGWGDAAGGYAQTCEMCGGAGRLPMQEEA